MKLIVLDDPLIIGNIDGIDIVSFVFMDECTGLLVVGRGIMDVLSSRVIQFLDFCIEVIR